jgi:lipoate-protein ligase B
LGQADYVSTLDLQRRLHRRRCAREIGDIVLSVEHNPVLTLGRSGSRRNILAPDAELAAQGIEVHQVERGGDVTYHGPGQLVVYPIVDLRRFGKDIRRFIWTLEEAILRTLGSLGVLAERRDGYPGAWIGSRKVASIGVYVKGWVSYHGLALNVNVSREHMRLIRPCGLSIETISVDDVLDSTVKVTAIRTFLLRSLSSVWGAEIVDVEVEEVA